MNKGVHEFCNDDAGFHPKDTRFNSTKQKIYSPLFLSIFNVSMPSNLKLNVGFLVQATCG